MSNDEIGSLQTFRDALIGLPLSHLWRGYGSAIFLEFGRLTQSTRTRSDGSPQNPRGEFSLMIEWSWRIEGTRSILCGSGSDAPLWEPTFDLLRNRAVTDLSVAGRLPEVVVALTEDHFVSSFMTAEGDPSWALLDRRGDAIRTLHVREGKLKTEIILSQG